MVNRLSRIVAIAGSLLLTGTGVLAAAGPADALTIKPRTYTAVMTPTSIVPGQATPFSVTVKNTSSVISALDHFVLLAPTGFTVTPGTVTAPRGGWTETFASGQLSASTAQPLRYGLRKGESMTVRFTATDTVACDARTTTWTQKADGAIIDPFVAQSPDPTVTATPVADRFVVTSVTDGSTPPLDHQVVVGQPFTVAGQFRCQSQQAPAPASVLSLTKSAPGTPDNGGTLGGTLSVNVAGGTTQASISGATYSAVENAVGVAVGWTAGAGDGFSLDVLADAASVTGTPGTPINPAALTVDGASADLGNGANGPVTIAVTACGSDQTTTAPCSDGTQVQLTGNFKDTGGAPLYSFAAPARIVRVCSQTDCPHPDQNSEPSSHYDYNHTCSPASLCAGGEREVEEDFAAYPTYVSIHKNGADTPFAVAPRCVPASDLTTTGQITDAAAQAAGFCVDVNAMTRTGNAFSGDLNIPVLFVEDLKLRP